MGRNGSNYGDFCFNSYSVTFKSAIWSVQVDCTSIAPAKTSQFIQFCNNAHFSISWAELPSDKILLDTLNREMTETVSYIKVFSDKTLFKTYDTVYRQ